VCFRVLVERLENMRRSAVGNGLSQCLLCGEVFGLLGSSSVLCLDCCMVQTGLNVLNFFSTTHTHCLVIFSNYLWAHAVILRHHIVSVESCIFKDGLKVICAYRTFVFCA